MKFITAAIVLSSLLFVEANAASSVNQTDIDMPSVTAVANLQKTIKDASSSLSSVEIAIQVPPVEDDDDEGNSPALDDGEDNEEEAEETEEGLSTVDGDVDENIFASAGLVYNREKDLPVYSKGAKTSDDDYPPIPQVVACRTDGQVAITYSEGPSDVTARIARQLNNASASANFFVNTNWLNRQEYAMVLQNVYNAGHLIGMTYRLPNEEPEAMSNEEIKADIIKSARMIETLIQVSPKYVRLHFSAQNDGRAEHILRDLGFILVGYNLDGKDYVHKTGELIGEEYGRTFKQYNDTHNSKGSFVAIQYDIPETTSLTAVPHIIKKISSGGYTAVRMDGCLNDAKPYKKTAAGLEYVADKFSFGSAGYHSGQKIATVISNTTVVEEEGIRGLSAKDDEFISEASALQLTKKIGFSLIPALLAAFML